MGRKRLLIRLALPYASSASLDELRACSENTRRKLLGAASEHRVLLAIARSFAAAGIALPAEFAHELNYRREMCARLSLTQDVLSRKLSASGIAAAFIKGRTFANLYPPEYERQTSDLDLVAPASEAWSTIRLLAHEGFKLRGAALRNCGGGPGLEGCATLVRETVPSRFESIDVSFGAIPFRWNAGLALDAGFLTRCVNTSLTGGSIDPLD